MRKAKRLSKSEKVQQLRRLLIEQSLQANQAKRNGNTDAQGAMLFEREITLSAINGLKLGNLR